MRKPDRAVPAVAQSLACLALAAVVLLTLAACEQPTPEERVVQLRSEYSAELNSFNVREVPLSEEAVDVEVTEEVAEEVLDEGGPGEPQVEVMEAVPVRQDVMLDIVVRKEGSTDRLDGITLDVYQVEANEAEKANYRIYVDVSRLNPGSRTAVSHVLEDVDYAEGDGFAVEVRAPVPPEIRGEYKEFQEAMSGGDVS